MCFLSYADKVVYKVRGAESAFCHHMAVGRRDRSGVFVERYQKPENGILADKAMSGHRGTRSADKVSGQR